MKPLYFILISTILLSGCKPHAIPEKYCYSNQNNVLNCVSGFTYNNFQGNKLEIKPCIFASTIEEKQVCNVE